MSDLIVAMFRLSLTLIATVLWFVTWAGLWWGARNVRQDRGLLRVACVICWVAGQAGLLAALAIKAPLLITPIVEFLET